MGHKVSGKQNRFVCFFPNVLYWSELFVWYWKHKNLSILRILLFENLYNEGKKLVLYWFSLRKKKKTKEEKKEESDPKGKRKSTVTAMTSSTSSMSFKLVIGMLNSTLKPSVEERLGHRVWMCCGSLMSLLWLAFSVLVVPMLQLTSGITSSPSEAGETSWTQQVGCATMVKDTYRGFLHIHFSCLDQQLSFYFLVSSAVFAYLLS